MRKQICLILLAVILLSFTINIFATELFDDINLDSNVITDLDKEQVKGEDVKDDKDFQKLITDLFGQRDKAILTKDTEGLKSFYNVKIKVSLWAYESEIKKVKYLENWSEKQAVTFNNISSKVKVKKVKKKPEGIYTVICSANTEFSYNYIDQPEINNAFNLATYHYLNVKETDGKYIITKEWYTDPFADSLELQKLKTDDVKAYILSKEKKEFPINDRLKNAIDYAHKYCGASMDDEFIFKYNHIYKNFNPDGGDCANFASQIMHEGGKFKKTKAWNYSNKEGTKAWVNAQGFKNYTVGSGRGSMLAKGTYPQIYKASFNMRPGDFVAYEKNNRIVHISTVTGNDSKGYPLVTCHNTDRLLVPFDLGWSNNNIKFHLVHVHY